MNNLPAIFRKYTTQLWYIFLSAAFFFVFMVVYQPFGTKEAFDMGRNLQIVNVAILTSIVVVTLLILRTVFYLLSNALFKNWWQYIAWIMFELTALSYFFALYIYLVGGRAIPYFEQLAYCLQYSFLTLLYPYFGITIVCVVISLVRQPSTRERETVRFVDSNRQVKIVLLKDAILYVQADENYVKVGDKVTVQGKLQRYFKDEVVTPEVAQGGKILTVESGSTGINNVKANVENAVRYNLAGQKVNNGFKGVVIMNGKKMLQK